jgi:hypothetical protein
LKAALQNDQTSPFYNLPKNVTVSQYAGQGMAARPEQPWSEPESTRDGNVWVVTTLFLKLVLRLLISDKSL